MSASTISQKPFASCLESFQFLIASVNLLKWVVVQQGAAVYGKDMVMQLAARREYEQQWVLAGEDALETGQKLATVSQRIHPGILHPWHRSRKSPSAAAQHTATSHLSPRVPQGAQSTRASHAFWYSRKTSEDRCRSQLSPARSPLNRTVVDNVRLRPKVSLLHGPLETPLVPAPRHLEALHPVK